MYMRRTNNSNVTRQGLILIVVLALLTLFAVVGLSFVLYADSEADASRNFREANVSYVPDMDPEQAFAYALGQIIYDVDDVAGVYSGIRGHSLSRTEFGWCDETLLLGGAPIPGVTTL